MEDFLCDMGPCTGVYYEMARLAHSVGRTQVVNTSEWGHAQRVSDTPNEKLTRHEKITLIVEIGAAIGAGAAAIIALIALGEASNAAETATRLAAGQKLSWYTFQGERDSPANQTVQGVQAAEQPKKRFQFENHSPYAAYNTLLWNDCNDEYFKLLTVPPCTSAYFELEKGSEWLANNLEHYHIQYRLVGDTYEGVGEGPINKTSNVKPVDERYAQRTLESDSTTRYKLQVRYADLPSCG